MNSSNNYKLYPKYYLKLFEIVLAEIGGYTLFVLLAMALNGLISVMVKKYKNYPTTYFHLQNHGLIHSTRL